ncbi:metabolite-proton symporter [Rhodococcus wratislaviensis]|uniref:Putative proline/betaine transporter n=1 Tax=Rhodococcus wratislaviensis TaxID=44752 RepID=A0AB38F7N0_RHOWR|nr:MFS transporter [Rhodococcus wratislaviensis]REE76582.1 metabolite-proton symporter [Rhodococcus wratislaviensis]SPZ35983.1 MFS transporter [Rhodococcus wratislaviensis]
MRVIDDLEVTRVKPRKVAFASFVGTAIEWYDFFIFGTAAALVFGKAFFPSLSPLSGTLAAFATFGVAFVSRPAGAIVFGHFGDRIGRKKMLVFSLVLMGSSTVAIGLIPTYGAIGLAAPVLLVLARLAQGFAVGGEWGGAVLMAVEHAPREKRAFYGSWPQAGVPAGLVLATLAFLVVEQLPEDQVQAWGWRLPFLASAGLVAVGMYVRLKVVESPEFENVKRNKKIADFPILAVLRGEKRALGVGILTQAASLVPFYLVTVFVLSYGPKELGISRQTILLSILVACVLDILSVPYASMIADRIGARKMLIYGSLYMAAIAYPFFWLLSTGAGVAVLLAMILIITIGHAVTYSAVAGYVTGLFPAEVRYTGASVAYQFGGVVFSAPAPFIAVAIAAETDGSWALAAYIAAACAITVLVLTLTKTAKVNH